MPGRIVQAVLPDFVMQGAVTYLETLRGQFAVVPGLKKDSRNGFFLRVASDLAAKRLQSPRACLHNFPVLRFVNGLRQRIRVQFLERLPVVPLNQEPENKALQLTD